MRFLTLIVCLFLISSACNNNNESKTSTASLLYPDPFRENFKGVPKQIEFLNFTVDSSGNLISDSIAREVGEWENNYLQRYTEFDSIRDKKIYAFYSYYPSGLVSHIDIDENGKRVTRSHITIDSISGLATLQTFDAAGKIQAHYKDIKFDSSGMLSEGKEVDSSGKVLSYITGEFKNIQMIRSFTRDSAGKMISKYGVTLKEYDDQVADTTIVYGKDSTTTNIRRYKYEGHDSLKNWLTKTELNATGKPIRVIKRKITYDVAFKP